MVKFPDPVGQSGEFAQRILSLDVSAFDRARDEALMARRAVPRKACNDNLSVVVRVDHPLLSDMPLRFTGREVEAQGTWLCLPLSSEEDVTTAAVKVTKVIECNVAGPIRK